MAHSGSARDRILEAAASLFARFGFHETTIDEIAEHAAVAKGSIYYHFKGKDEILAELIDEGFRIIQRSVEASVDEVRSPLAQVQTLIRQHFALHVEYYDLARVLFSGTRRGLAPEATRRIDEAQERYRSYVIDLMEQGMRSGDFRLMEPEFLAASLIGSLNAVAQEWHRARSEGKKIHSDVLADELVDVCLEGLIARRSR